MPQSGAAPSSPNAMPGGLGAILQQPNQAPKGASAGDMAEMMAMAKELPDSELADVLNGKSIRIPQSLAMIVAMGRKSLRTAMQGAQAQQQAQQPSVKDRFLAEEAQMAAAPQAGLDQLPAPNMDSVDMAGGGIVAFQDNQDQPVREGMPSFAEGSETDKKILEFLKNAPGALVNKFKELNQPRPTTFAGTQAELDALVQRGKMPKRTAAETAAGVKDEEKRKVQLEDIARGQGVFPEGSAALPTGLDVSAVAAAAAPKAAPKATGIATLTAPKESDASPAREDLLAKLAGVGEKTRAGIAGLKNEAQSQMLFDAMSALLGNRNIAEAGSKFGQLASGRLGAMGKERRSLEKESNEYDLNLARYREAVESGDKDRAFKYKQAADENRYRMAMVNKPDSGIALLNALKDPEMMRRYQEMNMAKKPTDIVSRKDAMEEFNKYPALKRQYGDFETYFKTVNNQLLSATIPGQGAVIRPS
jgi:hypothetical protein